MSTLATVCLISLSLRGFRGKNALWHQRRGTHNKMYLLPSVSNFRFQSSLNRILLLKVNASGLAVIKRKIKKLNHIIFLLDLFPTFLSPSVSSVSIFFNIAVEISDQQISQSN